MDFNQMRYFIEICKTNSMSKAAENLFITQQGLSSAIRRLEKELDCDLFYRKPGGLVLTKAGEFFKDEAENIVLKVDNILKYFETTNTQSEKMVIACTNALITRLPQEIQHLLLNRVSGAVEDLCVDYVETSTKECETLVIDGTANIGIVFGECDEKQFDVIKLKELQQTFIVSKQSKFASQDEISIHELSGVPLILPSNQCRPGSIIRKLFEEAGSVLNVVVESNRPRDTVELISKNPFLVARIITEDIVSDDLERIKTLKFKDGCLPLPICLITKKGSRLNMATRLFKQMVISSFTQIYDASE